METKKALGIFVDQFDDDELFRLTAAILKHPKLAYFGVDEERKKLEVVFKRTSPEIRYPILPALGCLNLIAGNAQNKGFLKENRDGSTEIDKEHFETLLDFAIELESSAPIGLADELTDKNLVEGLGPKRDPEKSLAFRAARVTRPDTLPYVVPISRQAWEQFLVKLYKEHPELQDDKRSYSLVLERLQKLFSEAEPLTSPNGELIYMLWLHRKKEITCFDNKTYKLRFITFAHPPRLMVMITSVAPLRTVKWFRKEEDGSRTPGSLLTISDVHTRIDALQT